MVEEQYSLFKDLVIKSCSWLLACHPTECDGVQHPLACQSVCQMALLELELWPEEVCASDRTGNTHAYKQKCTSFSSLSDQSCFSSPKIKLTRTCHLVENNFADAVRLQALLSCAIQLNFSPSPNCSWMQVAVKPTGKSYFGSQRAEAQAAWSIPTCLGCVISQRAGS